MPASLKILMVRPRPGKETIGLQHLMIVEPLELEVLAACTDPSDKVHIVDLILEKKNLLFFLDKLRPDVLCLTGYITHIPVIIEHCREAKEFDPFIITIAGGVHIELCPDDLPDDAVDFKITRNATRAFPALLDFIRNRDLTRPLPPGVIGRNNLVHSQTMPEFDFFFPRPRRELTGKYRKNYFYVFHDKVALIKTSFGCPYSCNFCFCRLITGKMYSARLIPEVIDELESIQEKEIYIVDDDFLVSPKRVADFIAALKERKINKRFLLYGRADFIINNSELIREFKGAGLRTIIIGLESFFDDELKEYDKQLNASANERAMKILAQCGVDCYAAIILSPDYTHHDFNYLKSKIRELNIKFLNLQPLTPLQGTEIPYDPGSLVIDRADFARWDLAHVVIRPENMPLADYYRNIIRIYRSVAFRPKNIISHLKYPMRMHLKMAKGLFILYRQYHRMYKEALKNA